MSIMVVVQLGEAMRGGLRACGLISGMIKGAVLRKAEERSITVAPRSIHLGTSTRERALPAQKKARSQSGGVDGRGNTGMSAF